MVPKNLPKSVSGLGIVLVKTNDAREHKPISNHIYATLILL
jgi:hypothetical protein